MSSSTPYAVVIALSVVLAFGITCLRFYSRLRSTNGFHWNLSDSIIVTSLFLLAVTTAITFIIIYAPLNPQDPLLAVKVFFAGSMIYYSTLWSIKISISVSLIRLTKRLDRAARISKAGFYLVCATYVLLLVTNLCVCVPLTTLWLGTCGMERSLALFWLPIVLNIGTDIVLIIIPFPALMLIAERRTRIAILFVFGLAGIVVIVSTVRALLLWTQKGGIYLTIMLSHIEIATSIVISALPEVSRSFTRLYLQSTRGTHGKGSSSYRQRSRVTPNGVSLTRNENKERFTKLGSKHSQDPIHNGVENESAGGRPDSAGRHSALEFHTASTDQISPYSAGPDSSTGKAQYGKGILKTTTFEMKDL